MTECVSNSRPKSDVETVASWLTTFNGFAPLGKSISEPALARGSWEIAASHVAQGPADRSPARSAWDSAPQNEPSRRVRYDPPGHLLVALTHSIAPISYRTVSYTCGTGTLRACAPGVRVGLRSLRPGALSISGNFATGIS
jgi:hypothetical protein